MLVEQFGDAEVLQYTAAERPAPGEGEVLIEVRFAGLGPRGRALIHNFAPSCPWTVRESPYLRSPAERLNGRRYHPEWLQNLLVSASLGGHRKTPRNAD